MPSYYGYERTKEPKNFTAFSEFDSRRLETEYQKLIDGAKHSNFIPVNEDFLFEVDLQRRRMSPVYWEGAVYEVRRGSWFTDGQPVRESLAKQLEDGYFKMKPYEKQDPHNPLHKKTEQQVYNVDDEERVLYADAHSAYLLHKGYGGDLQLGYLKTVKSIPTTGARLYTRGFKDPEEEAVTDDKHNFTSLLGIEISNFFGEGDAQDDQISKEAMEKVIQQDYQTDDMKGARKIDHLILCVHGIGQMLGTKFQNVNFIHTVNIMRKNLKKVYAENKDFRQLTDDEENCRVQVLPISWRHKLKFNTTDDISETLPSLNDITVSEFKPMRNLIGSVLFDVLLYYEPVYLNQIYIEVTHEANRLFKLFKERNPEFGGKVSIIGHSLGSAIMLDVLSAQPDSLDNSSSEHLRFKVDNYFGVGSPVGVFKLLKGQNIGARSLLGPSTETMKTLACDNYYNIFHPCDPVGFRVEPLIRKDLKVLEPESVPFLIEDLKKQLSNIAQMGDDLKTKVLTSAVSAWANVSSLTKTANSLEGELDSNKEKKGKVVDLSAEQLNALTALNYNGRVDYALQQGLLDLSIVSGITAHVSYFEDENVAAFILREVLAEKKKVFEKKARTLVE